MKLRPLLTLCAALLALSPGHATAQTTSAVPNFISYQGRVVDASGNNVGAVTPVNRTVIFRIWDTPSSTNAANLIYSEAQTVTVSDGEFSVLVGQGVANPTATFGYNEADKKLTDLGTAFNGKDRYLGVTVAATATIATTDNEITPRQQIVSTAFAMRAKVAESVDTNAISSAMLATGAVGSTQLAGASVTNAKMAASSVTSANIVDGTITSADIGANAVGSTQLAGASVTNAKMAASSVTSANIVDGTITSADIAANAVGAAQIAANAVTTVKIADGSVTLAKIAANAVDSSKIVDGSVTGTDIANSTITLGKMAANSVSSSQIVDGSVTAADLGANTVTTVENLRIIRGTISPAGAVLLGTGFTCTRTISGIYQVNFTTAFSGVPTITTTATGHFGNFTWAVFGAGATVFPNNGAHAMPNANGFSSGLQSTDGNFFNRTDTVGFHFIAIGPR
jgi:hypothetical protein